MLGSYGGGRGFTGNATLRTLFNIDPNLIIFVLILQTSPSLRDHTVRSDLLRFTSQVVVVSHRDRQEKNPTEEQENGRVGQDADFH